MKRFFIIGGDFMKKYLFVFGFLLFLMGCSNKEEYVVSDFFVAGDFTYKGGFENAGSKTTSKTVRKNGLRFIVEETTDTATRVERVYLVNRDSISLIYVGEDTHVNIDDLNLTNGEIILKAPLTVGKNWKSGENIYEIVEFIDAESGSEVTVEKRYPSGTTERTTYQNGFGKVQKTTTMVN